MSDGEGNLLKTICVVAGRSAFKVDSTIGEQWNAGRRRHRSEFNRELVELELFLHGVDDFVTDVHGKPDRLLVVVEIGKWNRRVAIAKGDRASFLDFSQRPRELFSAGLCGTNSCGGRKANHTQSLHSYSPRSDDCGHTQVRWPSRARGHRSSRQTLHRLVGIRIGGIGWFGEFMFQL